MARPASNATASVQRNGSASAGGLSCLVAAMTVSITWRSNVGRSPALATLQTKLILQSRRRQGLLKSRQGSVEDRLDAGQRGFFAVDRGGLGEDISPAMR